MERENGEILSKNGVILEGAVKSLNRGILSPLALRRDKKRPEVSPVLGYWWSRRESNPRPQILHRKFYILSSII